MARIDVTEDEAVAAVVERLRTSLALPEARCYETVTPLAPTIPPGGDYFLTVCSVGGSFDESLQLGGAEKQLTEDGEILVTIFSRMKLDRADHDVRLLRDASRGLRAIKKLVLAALVGHDPVVADDGSVFARELIPARRSQKPEYDGDKQIGWLTLAFGLSWDWTL